ncbi:MAG: MaoC family dehydratase N-terminal domain-containing protein [Hyphomonadaceae bacterium]|nr:MaoC family dehydratase N-terminal domain-containing protein [Hyphomonadaceae bacterium]
MSSEVLVNPRGIFDRGALGVTLEAVPVLIERQRVRFFAQVLGETNLIHFDADVAHAAGHHDLVAPASFFMVVEAAANEERGRRALPSLLDVVVCDFRYLLHGDERYFYDAPIYAGEEVLFASKVVDFYDKKGGAMEFVVTESTITHPKRGVLMRSRRTLLHRLPDAKDGSR